MYYVACDACAGIENYDLKVDILHIGQQVLLKASKQIFHCETISEDAISGVPDLHCHTYLICTVRRT